VDRGLVFYSVFLVCLCASAVVVWYFARHNPNPRFRPRFGEIVMVSIIALGLSTGMSYFLSGILGSDAAIQDELKQERPSTGRDRSSGGGANNPYDRSEDEEEDSNMPPLPWLRGGDK
jgi:hypothetical protein